LKASCEHCSVYIQIQLLFLHLKELFDETKFVPTAQKNGKAIFAFECLQIFKAH
jgi:hypothetical protein